MAKLLLIYSISLVIGELEDKAKPINSANIVLCFSNLSMSTKLQLNEPYAFSEVVLCTDKKW